MPQSLSIVHLVFSTKDRRPFLRSQKIRQSFHAYLGGISKRLDCPPILVGGVEDHVHMLVRFGRTITQAEWVKELKRVSNQWLKKQGVDLANFGWQGGYADPFHSSGWVHGNAPQKVTKETKSRRVLRSLRLLLFNAPFRQYPRVARFPRLRSASARHVATLGFGTESRWDSVKCIAAHSFSFKRRLVVRMNSSTTSPTFNHTPGPTRQINPLTTWKNRTIPSGRYSLYGSEIQLSGNSP